MNQKKTDGPLQNSGVTNDNNNNVMTPDHPMWTEFSIRLARQIGGVPGRCTRDCRGAGDLLAEFGANIPASLQFFKRNGGGVACAIFVKPSFAWGWWGVK